MDQPPISATVSWINGAGLAVLAAATLLLPRTGLSYVWLFLLTLSAPAATIIVFEKLFIRTKIPFTPLAPKGHDAHTVGTPRFQRIFLKTVGVGASIFGIVLVYWLFPLYRDGTASNLREIAGTIWVPLLLLTPVYIWFVDTHLDSKEDGYFHAGLLVTGEWGLVDFDVIRQHCLQWLVKAFFLPLMVNFYSDNLLWLQDNPVENFFWPFLERPSIQNWLQCYEFLYRYFYLIDVAFGTIGYVLTLKILDAHLRSAEPTLKGWVVCLACYPPFWPIAGQQFLNYDSGLTWGYWFDGAPVLKLVWSLLMLSLVGLYVWATVQFGVRFSNLTNRGILTNGPYRWLKHPAYLSKNLSWWLMSVPFLSAEGPQDAIRRCILLLGVNLIYYLRAKTEEAHLMNDPVYRAYARFIEHHGVFARGRKYLAKLMPADRAGH